MSLLIKYKSKVSDALLNYKSVKLDRKIIVIESDDWGAVRMPSKVAYNNMLKKGISVDKCPYNTNDTLANSQDLEKLYTVLRSFKDKNGNHPVITANSIMANPDFDKIRNSGYKDYYYEKFKDTLRRYYPNENVFSLWTHGIDENVFFPQFHGREHLNINRWMKSLQQKLPETMLAFENELFGLSTTITSEKRKSYLPAFDFDTKEEVADHKDIIKDGLRIFEQTFRYNSQSFIAPNYTWSSALESILKEQGVNYIQGARAQQQPTEEGVINVKKHSTGSKNEYGAIFLARNVAFEPSLSKNKDWLNHTFTQIENAFFWKAPAIITSHRLNYIGSLNKENRERSLELLNSLLSKVIKKWPDVEFMTTVGLGNLIAKRK